MRTTTFLCLFWSLLACRGTGLAQAKGSAKTAITPQNAAATSSRQAENAVVSLDAGRERRAMQVLLQAVRKEVVSAAEAMPANKYGFTPTDGEFKGVRTFGQQVKHLSATNQILAASALGEEPPADAGDEMGPEGVRTKAEILDYLNASFAHLGKAIDAIDSEDNPAKHSPISPMKAGEVTRLGLTVEALVHAFDHYGQMVEYLRMNGVVPPASRP